ncbi:MAG: hypothetical protein IE885_07510 [Campylobacterales bacterium]|nr:hypothetical protein [Campylobacterales bacterium]
MRKLFLSLLLISVQLHALEKESTFKIYSSIFNALGLKKPITVYVKGREYKEVFKGSGDIKISDSFEHSDIVLVTSVKTLDWIKKKIDQNFEYSPLIFATDYHFLKKEDRIIGAFYWRKGRSQLLFLKKRLEFYHIQLPREYQQFIVDEL